MYVGVPEVSRDTANALEIYVAYVTQSPGTRELRLPGRPGPLFYVTDVVLIRDGDVIGATIHPVDEGFQVMLELSDDASNRMMRATEHHEDLAFAIYVDGNLVSIPRVLSQIGPRVAIPRKPPFALTCPPEEVQQL